MTPDARQSRWDAREAAAAGRDAAAIGGWAGDETLDPAQRPLVEAGEGVAEGFEVAEEDLIEAAENRESRANPRLNAFTPEAESDQALAEFGEADHEASSEVGTGDR